MTAPSNLAEATSVALETARAVRDSRPLRLITCGSVDDGKSTLIGRLINDATGLFEDQIKSLQDDSRRFGPQHRLASGRDLVIAPSRVPGLSLRPGG